MPLIRVLRGARILLFLFGAVATCLPVQAADRVHFSNWEFELPESLTIVEQSTDKLVLHLVPGLSGSAILTFYAPQALQGDPTVWLDKQWQRLRAGHRIVFEAPLGQAALMDGTEGLRRDANTGNGEGFLQADAYPAGDRIQLMTAETEGEQGLRVFMTLLIGIRLSDAGEAPQIAAAPAAIEPLAPPSPQPDIKPRPLGPDPYDNIDWKTPKVVLRTTADLDEIEVKPALDIFLKENSKLLGGVKPKQVSFPDAIDAVRVLVKNSTSADHLVALHAYPNYQKREKLLDSAAGVLLKGKITEALARLQIAYERWPDDAEVLFNTAALLSQGRLANESLAILDEMGRKGKLPSISFGIQSQSGMDYLRGYNLMQLGRFSEADALISKVVSNEPDFAEASLTAALLAYKLGKNPTTFYINGYYRRNGGEMKTSGQENESKSDSPTQDNQADSNSDKSQPEDNIGEDDTVALSAVHYIDVSRGTPGKLSSIYQPTTIEDSLKFQEFYKAQVMAGIAETQAMDKTRRRLDRRWRKKIPPGPQMEYYEEILRMFSEANARMPEIQRLLRARNRAIEDSTEAGGRFNDWFSEKYLAILKRYEKDPPRACPEINALVLKTHDSLRVHVQAVDLATRRLHRLWHRYATALGTIVSDPDFRNYLAFDINFANQVEYGFLVANMWESTQYAGYAQDCSSKKSSREWAKDIEESKLAACDEGATAGLSFSYGPVTVSSSCEGFTLGLEFDVGPVEVSSETEVDSTGKVQKQKTGGKVDLGPVSVSGHTSRDKEGKKENAVGVEGGIPGLKGKAEITMDNQGSTSVYAGGKAGGEIGGAGVKVGASQESGMVVTVKDGAVSDVALKSTTSATATIGGAGVNQSETRTMSLMPGPSVSRGSLPLYRG